MTNFNNNKKKKFLSCLSAIITQLRKESKLKQYVLAKKIGISHASYHRIESGKDLSVFSLMKISSFYKMETGEILDRATHLMNYPSPGGRQ